MSVIEIIEGRETIEQNVSESIEQNQSITIKKYKENN